MADYINRELIRNELYDSDAITMRGIAILNKFPSADVVEVVHGQWIKYYVYAEDPHDRLRYKCSVCGRTEEYREPYCNCGAKMDGEPNG